jgi:tetratricopeptide (TPR) repeat protein
MKRQLFICLLSLALVQFASLAFAQTADYYRYMRIAEQARQEGDFHTALINYGRALRESRRDPAANEGIDQLLEEHLQRMEADYPDYVRYVRIADAAVFDGDYDTAIINFRRALAERPGDYYAGVRLQQAECIKYEQPGTLSQFEFMCPSLYPSESEQ